ncbi:MAB_1171c family putative transporter [Streptomyces sp. NPDC048567]|uniref:MAB_1171c family putative transporter n=1 Tax=Streptomyces sp. NPDC048567 TaxID=3365570 RepID=UPI003723BD32
MNYVFLGMSFVLAAASGYWMFGRGTPRPTGTWAMGGLLGAFALAFASYAPLVEDAVEALVPHVARLLSNCASLGAAAAVVAVILQLNMDPAEARRRIRVRLALLAAAVASMTLLFAYEHFTNRSPEAYALYLLLYISYLGFAVVDFLGQALRQSASTRRSSVRIGLRIAATGCGFALIYVAYKTTRLVDLALGLGLMNSTAECSTLVGRCAFSVTAPALAVLLICLGLTLPTVAYPISQARRRRWEVQSFEALGPLWRDLSAAMPHIVLSPAGTGDVSTESDFLLQRRVIEISDGVLALRPYRSRDVQEAVQATVETGTVNGAATVEAAILAAALADRKAGRLPDDVAPRSPEAASRKDLKGDTEWLLLVASAYARHAGRVANGRRPEPVGAWDHD